MRRLEESRHDREVRQKLTGRQRLKKLREGKVVWPAWQGTYTQSKRELKRMKANKRYYPEFYEEKKKLIK